MYITEINIVNFKSFGERFNLKFNKDLNILVGDNEAGKSTILEAINLVLTGTIGGKFIKNELSQYLFNNAVVDRYIAEVNKGEEMPQLPEIYIEVHLSDDNSKFRGNDNLDGVDSCGLYIRVDFNDDFKGEYEELIKNKEIKTLPIEYYDFYWSSFARNNAITTRSIPIKSALIDTSSSRFQNGSDVYVSRIVRDLLKKEDIVAVSQADRKMKDDFGNDDSVRLINKKLEKAVDISNKDVALGVDLSPRNAWEGNLLTCLDKVPFHHIGKGEQSIVKTKLALNHKKSQEANVILLEEPENHLSHTKLNNLIKDITDHKYDKQIIVSTHNSFVANKLGLDKLVLLNNHQTTTFNDLTYDTQRFFSKLAGYNTLRLMLCQKAILVEGDSDELIIQKAYMSQHNGLLPIEDGIDVISVGTSFLRFLEIAEKINKTVAVVTDNDGDVDAVKKKYANYIEDNKKNNIDIYFDNIVDQNGALKDFNYNTLEPKMLKANGRDVLNEIFGKFYKTDDELLNYMHKNKTECALAIFETEEQIKYPQYILDAIT